MDAHRKAGLGAVSPDESLPADCETGEFTSKDFLFIAIKFIFSLYN